MSLYGRLYGELSTSFQRQCSALKSNCDLINRFGEALAHFPLTPRVRTRQDGSIGLVAVSKRGSDANAVVAELRHAHYAVSQPAELPHQLNDGYVMWCAAVKGHGLEFDLLLYTSSEVFS